MRSGFPMASPRLAKVNFRVTHPLLRIPLKELYRSTVLSAEHEFISFRVKLMQRMTAVWGAMATSASPVNGSKGPIPLQRRYPRLFNGARNSAEHSPEPAGTGRRLIWCRRTNV